MQPLVHFALALALPPGGAAPAAASAAAGARVAALQPPPLALRVDSIVQPDGAIGPGGWIVVRNGRIESVGGGAPAAGAAALEFAGGVAMAGFVDVATVLGAGGQLSEPARAFTPEIAAADAFDGDHSDFLAAARTGVTTVGLVPGASNVVGGRIGIVRTSDDDGRGAAVAGHGPLRFTLTEEPFGGLRAPTSRMGALPILREMLANQKMALAGSSLVAADTADQIRIAVETFGAAGRPFALLQPARIDEAIELVTGKTAGAVLGPFDLDSSERDLRVSSLLAAAQIPITFTANGDGNALRLTAALATRSGLEARLARAALSATGARLLGIDGDAGTLEPGRRGDLVVFDGDPLDLAAQVQLVLVGGAAVATEEEAR